jgi:hypothetical protein
MFACRGNDKRRPPTSHMATSVILLLTCLWVFLGTIDGPSVRSASKSGYDVYKNAKSIDPNQSAQPWLLSTIAVPENYPSVHASFLLFDFKQNLRRWPNVAGDISRSPPLVPAT